MIVRIQTGANHTTSLSPPTYYRVRPWAAASRTPTAKSGPAASSRRRLPCLWSRRRSTFRNTASACSRSTLSRRRMYAYCFVCECPQSLPISCTLLLVFLHAHSFPHRAHSEAVLAGRSLSVCPFVSLSFLRPISSMRSRNARRYACICTALDTNAHTFKATSNSH